MKINFSTGAVWVALLALATSSATADTRMQVTAASAPVRTQPSSSAPQVGKATAGEILFVSRVEGDWAAVSPPDRLDVWLNKDFIEGNRVIAKSIQIRSGPGVQHDIVGTLERGAPVMPRGEEGDWCKIAPPSSVTLWVAKSDLSEITARTTPIREVAVAPKPAPPPPEASVPAPAPAPKSESRPEPAPEAPAPSYEIAQAPAVPAPIIPPSAPVVAPQPPPAPPAPVVKVAPSNPKEAEAQAARSSAPAPTPAPAPAEPRTTPAAPMAASAAPARPVTETVRIPPAPAPLSAPAPQIAPPPPPAAPTLRPATAIPGPAGRPAATNRPAPASRPAATPMAKPGAVPASRPAAKPAPAAQTVPAPAAAVVAQKSKNVDVTVDQALVDDLDLDDSLPNQGKSVQVEGELRNAPFMAASPSRYRLVDQDEDGVLEMVCHVHGDPDTLRDYIGKGVSIRGREYWVEESDMPVVVVGKIVPLAPADEPVMY